MWLSSFALLGGLVLLTVSADRFVQGAAAIARNLGISPLIIGMTIVGFGTSAPEMMVSTIASLKGNADLAVGNAVGSNIINISLVLGLAALISPLTVNSSTLRREFPTLFFIMAGVFVLIYDHYLSLAESIALLAAFVGLNLWIVYLGVYGQNSDPLQAEFAAEIPTDVSMGKALFWTLAGLTVLIIGSRLLVWGAINIAQALGVSDLVIGLTIVALGTSLPELAATIMSALKKEDDIALGNILGSNMFNLLAVLGIPGLIAPITVEREVIYRDFPVMLVLTTLLWIFSYEIGKPGRINRIEGGLFLILFLAYLVLLYQTTIPQG